MRLTPLSVQYQSPQASKIIITPQFGEASQWTEQLLDDLKNTPNSHLEVRDDQNGTMGIAYYIDDGYKLNIGDKSYQSVTLNDLIKNYSPTTGKIVISNLTH